MELIEETIEIEKDVYKSLLNYCEENDLSINQFIKSNLELIGEY